MTRLPERDAQIFWIAFGSIIGFGIGGPAGALIGLALIGFLWGAF